MYTWHSEVSEVRQDIDLRGDNMKVLVNEKVSCCFNIAPWMSTGGEDL